MWHVLLNELDSRSESGCNYYKKLVDGLIDFSSGTASGLACVAIGQPLDCVKTKMQAFPNLYRTSLQCLLKTVEQDGIQGLYAGSTPALLANTVENATMFAFYGFARKLIANYKNTTPENLAPYENASAGAIAAFFGTFVVSPAELIKCKLQVFRESKMSNLKTHTGPLEMLLTILRTQGIRGLYVGFSATIFRETVGHYFFFGGYELAWSCLNMGGCREKGLLETALCGAFGGLAFWLSIFPIDMAKSKIQVQGYGTTWTAIRETQQLFGIKGLFSGLGPILLKTVLTSAGIFVTFEESRKLLKIAADRLC